MRRVPDVVSAIPSEGVGPIYGRGGPKCARHLLVEPHAPVAAHPESGRCIGRGEAELLEAGKPPARPEGAGCSIDDDEVSGHGRRWPPDGRIDIGDLELIAVHAGRERGVIDWD